MVLENHMKLCVTEPDFPEKIFLPQKWAKTWYFEFIEKFCHQFLLVMFCNENLYYFLSFSTNPIFGS